MSQSSDSSTRALATLVTALGITIGATPATLHAQAPVKTPTREAVQIKRQAEAVQDKTKAKEAVQDKTAIEKEAVQGKQKSAVRNKVGASEKAAVQGKAPAATPARPF